MASEAGNTMSVRARRPARAAVKRHVREGEDQEVALAQNEPKQEAGVAEKRLVVEHRLAALERPGLEDLPRERLVGQPVVAAVSDDEGCWRPENPQGLKRGNGQCR